MLAPVCAVVLGVLSSVGPGCGEADPFTLTGGGNQGGGSSNSGTGGSGGVFVDNGKELFAGLEADLVTACGDCHETGGIADTPFLAGPDRYESILSWPGIVVKNPDDSLFNTYAITGSGHSGSNLDTAPGDLQARVQAWLEAEAAAISAPINQTPSLDPVTPILGFNAIYLTPLDPALEGVAVTFTAEELTPTSLKLDQIQIHTTSKTGVHIVHPVFAVYPKGKDGSADPSDSFADVDARIDESTSTSLGVGLVILTNWESGAKLGIGFEVVEPYSSGMGGGGGGAGGGTAMGPCNAQAEFDASAKPLLQQRCFGCHGGNNGSATAALDMSDLQTDSSAACGQIKNRINTGSPNDSQIFVTTDPNGNASHPYKFGGDDGLFDTFRTQVSLWITAE